MSGSAAGRDDYGRLVTRRLSSWTRDYHRRTAAPTGRYDARLIGTGSHEFRKVLNAGVSLTAAIALLMVDEECRGAANRSPGFAGPEPLGAGAPLDGSSHASAASGKIVEIVRCPSV